MACTGCTSKFSFLRKELTCSECKFSFCSKCLIKVLQKSGPEKVCQKCFEKKTDNSGELEPPALLLKRLESLSNPSKPPVVVYNADRRLASLKRGLSEADQDIVERLEKLKENPMSVPSEIEIKQRLEALKGNQTTQDSTSVQEMPVSKSAQEEVDELMSEFIEEMSLTQQPSVEEDLEKRLAMIKGNSKPCKVDENYMAVESDDENEMAARYVKQVLEEAALPDSDELPPPNFSSAEWEPAESELPWCELCNGDATIRCLGCDGALYCRRCLKESHDSFEIKNHKTIPFDSKPTTSTL